MGSHRTPNKRRPIWSSYGTRGPCRNPVQPCPHHSADRQPEEFGIRLFRPAINSYFLCQVPSRQGSPCWIEIDDVHGVLIEQHVDGYRRVMDGSVESMKRMAAKQGWREVSVEEMRREMARGVPGTGTGAGGRAGRQPGRKRGRPKVTRTRRQGED